MLAVEEGAGGSSTWARAWIFKSGKAKKVSVPGNTIAYSGKNKFVCIKEAFDLCSDGTGHTYNPYYFYWNGSKLIEYGGLKISQKQLKKVSGGTKILNEIKKEGTVKNIYYRSNKVINVNYRVYADNSFWTNYNVILKVEKGKLKYYYKTLEASTWGGVSKKAVTKKAKTPSSFPY